MLNGKIQNMLIGLDAARHEVLVISDSDTRVPPDYLTTIIGPLADPDVGYVCTLYRIAERAKLAEKLELLTMNVDFGPSLLFTYWTNVAIFCLGASTAVRKADLEATGGMASLAEFLVEDQEMGRRLIMAGKKMVLEPMTVDMIPDYAGVTAWWKHVVYWDQNTKAANPSGFASTILIRAVPFALIFAVLTGFSALGWSVLGLTLAIRLGCAAAIAAVLRDLGGPQIPVASTVSRRDRARILGIGAARPFLYLARTRIPPDPRGPHRAPRVVMRSPR